MGRREFFEEERLKKLVYIFSTALLVTIVIFITLFASYNKKLKEESNKALTELGKEDAILSNEELEETSFSSDSTVNNTISTKSTTNQNTSKKISKEPVQAIVENTVSNTIISNDISDETVEEKKELRFIAPVSGEIIKDFVSDTLIYSNTLKEWTTHMGIDIKADKTSIVVASEEGTVESIKNDPRYGLTIVIKHEDGFKTVYSNLLTTEFVKENEIVEKGQTIATVGDSASFEVSDDSHLHFEMYKDGECVNPTIYLKDI